MTQQEKTRKTEYVGHPFGPVFDENSRVLILGSIPSQMCIRDSEYSASEAEDTDSLQYEQSHTVVERPVMAD